LREIKSNWEYAHRLFQCVAVASRPLHVEELAEILAFDFAAGPIPKFYEHLRLEDPVYAVMSTCSSLLSIVNVEGSPVIQFSHSSVKEFLTSTRLAKTSDIITSRYHISMTSAHTLAAQACLGILLHLDEDITRDRLRKFPLAKYAAKHWIDHAQFEHVMPNVEEGIKQLFDPNKPHLATWIWIYDPADLWDTDERGERPPYPSGTPLHYAAICGFHTMVNYLVVEHALNINARGVYKESTPLHLASDKGHLEVVRVLLEHGADVEAQNEDKLTPLHRASRSGRGQVVRTLLEQGADAAAFDRNRMTPLHWASFGGYLEVARILLERSKDAAARDKNGWTPLHWAAFEGRVEIVRILLKRGVDATVRDKAGRTPLHRSSSEGHLQVTRVLLEQGVDTTAQDMDGRTVLHRASIGGHVKIVRFLLDHGVDMAVRDKKGRTPLHHASLAGHLEVTRVLLEHGSDTTIKDHNDCTPMELARRNRHFRVVHILLEYNPDVIAEAFTTEDYSVGTSRERHLSDANDKGDVRTDPDEEDEIPEFIEDEKHNRARSGSLRGVIDRYRLAVFGKKSIPKHAYPGTTGDSAGLSATNNDPEPPSLVGKEPQGRTGALHVHLASDNVLRATPPSTSTRSSPSQGMLSVMGKSSSMVSNALSLHSARTSFGLPSLKSKASNFFVNGSASSSDHPMCSARIASGADVTEAVPVLDVHAVEKKEHRDNDEKY
jgi:ankyrin repeat protein